MKYRLLILLPLLAACNPMTQSAEDKAPKMIAGNMQGVAIKYDGTTGGLHEAELLARHDCERWGRNPGLLNEATMTEGGSLGYFVCQ